MIQRIHIILLALATVLGIVAAVVVMQEMNHWKNAHTNIHVVPVITVKQAIAPHHVIESKDLVVKQVDKRDAAPGALANTKQIVGQYADTKLLPGQQIVPQMISSKSSPSSFALTIPKGMRAITIPDSAVIGVDHLITTGDRIDVLVAYSDKKQKTTATLFQNISVLYVDKQPQSASASTSNSQTSNSGDTITLALTPKQAEQLTYAETVGKLELTLRNPQDKASNTLQAVNQASFLH